MSEEDLIDPAFFEPPSAASSPAAVIPGPNTTSAIPPRSYWEFGLPQHSWDGPQDRVFTSEMLEMMMRG